MPKSTVEHKGLSRFESVEDLFVSGTLTTSGSMQLGQALADGDSHLILSSSVGSIVHVSGALKLGEGTKLASDADGELLITDSTETGNVTLKGRSGGQFNISNTRILFQASSIHVGGNTGATTIASIGAPNQFMLGTVASSNQLILTTQGNVFGGKDHGHAAQDNPTYFIHSSIDPEVDSGQFMALYNNGSGSFIESGHSGGHIILSSSDGSTVHASASLQTDGQLYSRHSTTLTPSSDNAQLDWNNGNAQILDLENATADVALTMSNPQNGASYVLLIQQDSSVARDIVWDANTIKWIDQVEPTVSAGGNAEDLFSFTYVSGTFYGVASQNFG